MRLILCMMLMLISTGAVSADEVKNGESIKAQSVGVKAESVSVKARSVSVKARSVSVKARGVKPMKGASRGKMVNLEKSLRMSIKPGMTGRGAGAAQAAAGLMSGDVVDSKDAPKKDNRSRISKTVKKDRKGGS
jgi:hypothetical protein